MWELVCKYSHKGNGVEKMGYCRRKLERIACVKISELDFLSIASKDALAMMIHRNLTFLFLQHFITQINKSFINFLYSNMFLKEPPVSSSLASI